MISLTLLGRIPSKKNSRVTNTRTGRTFPNARYTKWHKDASNQLKEGYVWVECLQKVKKVELVFIMPDKRKCDLTNKAESVMDLLVDNNILEDDNWYVVPELIISCKEVNKEKAGVRIKIVI